MSKKQKWVSHSVSEWVSEWQCHLLSCQVTAKKANTVLSTSSPESEAWGQSLEGPGKPPNQTAPGDKERDGAEINLPTTSTNGGNSEGRSSSHNDEIGVKEIKKRVQKCIDDTQRILEHQREMQRQMMQRNEEKRERNDQAARTSIEAWTEHRERALSRLNESSFWLLSGCLYRHLSYVVQHCKTRGAGLKLPPHNCLTYKNLLHSFFSGSFAKLYFPNQLANLQSDGFFPEQSCLFPSFI